MPMMRRGPLDRYDAEWVLRQASAHDTSGSIEFHTDRPLTLYLRNGRVCHAVEGVAETGLADEPGTAPVDEGTAHERVVELVGTALAAADGWYYLDPIGHHAVATAWDWDGASLVVAARRRQRATGEPAVTSTETPTAAAPGPERTAPRTPTTATAPVAAAPERSPRPERRVELIAPADHGQVTLTAEAWRIACALAATREADALREDLGWTGARFDAALTELAAAGVLSAPSTAAEPPTPAEEEEEEEEAVPAPASAPEAAAVLGPAVHAPARARRSPVAAPQSVPPDIPPTVPPLPGSLPNPTVDRRRSLRRRISNTKPA